MAAVGHDVIWAGDWPEDPGDEEILDRAVAEGRILVTLERTLASRRLSNRHCLPRAQLPARWPVLIANDQGGVVAGCPREKQ